MAEKKVKRSKVKGKSKEEDLKQKCEEYLNGWKRAQADYQNLVKEFDGKRNDYVKYANANLIMEILPVLDNFKAAFNQIPEDEKDSPWVVGFGYIKKQLEDFLSQNGVEAVKTVGEKFDSNLHEAVEDSKIPTRTPQSASGRTMEPPSKKEVKANNIIVQEVRAGYTLNNKCVQVAKVIVGKEE
ncbi:nucleotide exchange factor GrpE [Candidatus Kuenenbacteria bacterium]|nr:nucleotide exchange factor GrpE [Candidatus Kuenenbacteria bacterium]